MALGQAGKLVERLAFDLELSDPQAQRGEHLLIRANVGDHPRSLALSQFTLRGLLDGAPGAALVARACC
jgi:hypothetical protein